LVLEARPWLPSLDPLATKSAIAKLGVVIICARSVVVVVIIVVVVVMSSSESVSVTASLPKTL
jgi:hypothetical protein